MNFKSFSTKVGGHIILVNLDRVDSIVPLLDEEQVCGSVVQLSEGRQIQVQDKIDDMIDCFGNIDLL